MNVAIVDDERHCIESLAIHLTNLYPKVNIVYKTTKVQKALKKLPELSIDLLFLDIEMPGLDGFQLLEQIPERNFGVIFVTAYSQYAVQAFKVKAVNYILKPIDENELQDAVKEWKAMNSKDQKDTQNIDQLLDYLKKEGIFQSKISVPLRDSFEFIEVDEIMYCQSHNNYTMVFLTNESKLLVSKTLKRFEKILDRFFFIRIHRSYLINPNYLKSYNRRDGGSVIMVDGETIPISVGKQHLVKEIFEQMDNI